MTPLSAIGERLGKFPTQLVKDRDLTVFEGPLVTLSRSPSREPYVEYWADRDNDRERWVVVRTSELELTKYLHQRTTLRELVQRAPDGYVFIADYSPESLFNVFLVSLEDLPEDLKPRQGGFHDPSFEPPDGGGNEQTILLEGEWDATKLSELQRRYTNVYSFLSVFSLADRIAFAVEGVFKNYRWRGGYIYKTAYDRIEHFVLHVARPKLIAVQYASPGYMRFRVDDNSADGVRKAVAAFKEQKANVDPLYHELHEILLDYSKRLDTLEPLTSDEEKAYDSSLSKPNKDLAEALGISLPKVMKVAENHRAAGFVLASYYRRLREFDSFQADERAQLL